MPNSFAYAMILTWPICALLISRKRASDQSAILLFLVPFLLLPVKTEFDLPGIPPFDKVSVPSLTVAAIFLYKYKYFKFIPYKRFIRLMLGLMLLFPLCTYLTNSELLVYGNRVFSGLTITNFAEMIFKIIALNYIPFIIGVTFLNTDDSHRLFLKLLVVCGLVYSIPILWEVRMSPQLHTDIYGFFPHSFGQQVRDGGFRPVVFLGHGLLVATFIAMACISAASLWKTRKTGLFIVIYLFTILLLCKTLGALLYAIIGLGVVMFLDRKRHIQASLVLAGFVFIFPILRGEGFIPTDWSVEFISQYSEERAQSLNFRFENEEILLEKANEKQFFGWGKSGRSRVYDPRSGEDLSVTDGYWIITFGRFGWLGYVTIFAFLCYPLIAIYRMYLRRGSKEISGYTSGLCLVFAFNLVDLIPNSSISHLTFLLAGALLGRVYKETENSKIPLQNPSVGKTKPLNTDN
jgi:hypothetical protein